MSGGRQSAYGYRYQYLATADHILRYLRNHLGELASIALHVEPTSLAQRGVAADDDIVDLAVEVEGVVVDKVQVKASSDPPNNQLYPGDASSVFDRLRGRAGLRAILLTNRPLSSGLADKCAQNAADERDVYEEWKYAGDSPASDDGADRDQVVRVDPRSIDELAASVASFVQQFRGDQALSQGEATARIVSIVLLHRIFGAAAGDEPSRLDALDLVGLLSMPDAAVAHAVGSFDWGVPINNIPTFTSTVPRLDLLNALAETLDQSRDVARPDVVVATGQTGHGKSALAADFCHLHHNSFEFMSWIDCSDPSLIESNVRRVTEELTGTRLPHRADPSARFHAALASHRGPWLIVYDGAAGLRHIEKFVPTQGNGCILITSVNKTGWWPSARTVDVDIFNDDEAKMCFGSYAGLAPTATRPAITDIVNRLGRIPLAISMAGLYFRNASGTVEELSADYFAELEALEDTSAIPPGFDKTAFAAIEHAVRHLGDDRSGRSRHEVLLAQAMLYRAALLSPDLIPLNYLIAAMPESGELRLGDLPAPALADAAKRRRYITIFRTQSIAHRVLTADDAGRQIETTETIEIHPLVHEILRNLFLRIIPRDQLQFQLSIMMNVLHGWILHMRNRNEFFAVDQLVSHAEALMRVFSGLGDLPSLSAKHDYLFRYTKIRLQLEIGTCRMSRGDLTTSVNLARTALLELSTLPRDAIRDAVALEAVSAIIVDLSTAGSNVAIVRPFAAMAERALISCESFGANSARLAYEKAYLVRSFLNRRVEYRDDPTIAVVLRKIDEVIARDPSDEVRPNAVIDHINELVRAGDLDATDPLVATLRLTANAHDTVTLDCLQADIDLRRGQFDCALPAIESLVNAELHESHLALPLSQGLGKVFQTLEQLALDGVGPSTRLAAVAERVRLRVEELHTRVLAESGGS